MLYSKRTKLMLDTKRTKLMLDTKRTKLMFLIFDLVPKKRYTHFFFLGNRYEYEYEYE